MFRAILFFGAGVCVLVFCNTLLGFAGKLIALPAALIFFYPAFRIWFRAMQARQRPGEEVLREDPRPPILYLRSFTRDDQKIKDFFMGINIFYGVPNPTFESVLKTATRKIGPLIAIGRPGEEIQPLGGSRIYADNDKWQGRINELLASAQLVVISLDQSPGLEWEIERVFSEIPPSRTLLVALRGTLGESLETQRSTTIDRCNQIARNCRRAEIPQTWGRSEFAVFDPEGKPVLIPCPFFPMRGQQVIGGLNRAIRHIKTHGLPREPAS